MSDDSQSPFDFFSERNESGGSVSDFFKNEIFGQQQNEEDAEAVNRLTHKTEPSYSDQNQNIFFKFESVLQGLFDNSKDDASKADFILDIARDFTQNSNSTLNESDSHKELELFWNLLQEAKGQWENVAADSKVKKMDLFAFLYYIGHAECKDTPSHKRRSHRFCPSLEVDTLYDLHDALYLAAISYLPTKDAINEALNDFNGSPWVLVYCALSTRPREPAHFICLKKEQEHISNGGGFKFPWQERSVLDVLLVVRGTKDINDFLSDALIETEPFRDGLSHGGIQKSGSYLVEKHTELLKKLLDESKRAKIRLSLIGHSLGAGAAAIAAIEFNKLDYVDAKAIGFGCPPCLSENLSESTKDYITTVICDSDVVPRLSGATISNVVMTVMSQPYTEMAALDVQQILETVEKNSFLKPNEEQKKALLEYIRKGSDEAYEKNKVILDPVEVKLFPPGKCIHLYRNGSGISGAYVPCAFFNEIEVSRTMVMDHLPGEGYDRVFHELMRGHLKKNSFCFRHNLEKIAAQSD